MKNEITVDITVKEYNGKHLVTIDKMIGIPVNNAIEILNLKYSTKGIFNKICKGLNILSEDLEKLIGIKPEDGRKRKKR